MVGAMIKRIRTFLFKDEDGVAAVEFAILAPVFFAVMSSVFEITYFAYTSTSIQRAVEDAIDSIRTGHVYTTMLANGWNPEQWYRNEICSNIAIPDCMTALHIQVQTFNSDFDLYKDSDVTNTIDTGASGVLMRVEARIEVPKLFLTSVIFGDDAITAKAGLTFMTEPY
jgi:Flp pilus assembly protein TadG